MQRSTFLTTANRLSASPSRSVVHTTVKPVAVLVLATLAAAILSTDAISQEAKRDTMKKIEIARGPANAAALRRERAQFLHAQQQQYLIAMQQQLAAQRAYVDQLALERYYAVQDLWIVTMVSPRGQLFFKPYLGRDSGQAQRQASSEFPFAMIQHIRRYNFRSN